MLNIQSELNLAYKDLGYNSLTYNGTTSFFGYLSFLLEKENGDIVLYHLHIGDTVSINIEDGENFAMIRAIFCHQQNNEGSGRFAFIIVNWFEELNGKILGCPVYRLIRGPKKDW